jgi:hypothetical protein
MSHENMTRELESEGSSDRSFGLVFAAVFVVLTIWPALHGGSMRWWASAVAAAFAVIAMTKPSILGALNRAWTKLGILMGRFVSPIALGILFYAVLTPIGVLMRLTGADPLRLKRDATSNTYWITREPPGPAPGSMDKQF